ncbi:NACHT, LRR and PYD domains-containing protein 6 [Denticeps clupeoides]|uniref:NACHT, LRR and PYD domains-containing protein 6 n=1 Tax=Denticeps clupeoides TaxID=299321 RepID=UPI0010A52DB5|nr:NACHT, LRR and PYD domains-containing protein 6-like [Denticeps clupeoides]XP_028828371.1 NACHT, LRR and PYD domains-containing protein 6-like [Denticeps clupeoides]XP_028828372.1 NACHT, LRR and PYD domains-containing protein 6-like [Denticeps clupeoides]
MTSAIQLLRTFDDLGSADFRRFKTHLRDRGAIPWGKLEAADRCDTAEMMVEHYTAAEAGGVAVTLLQAMGLRQAAADLLARLPPGGSPEGSGGRPTGAAPASVVNITASDGSVVHAPTISRCNIGGSVNFSTNNKK